MKKFIIAIMCVVCVTTAYAANENAATSKEYVDTAIATKQPTIPAAGNNIVMTFDSTADNGIGTKNIYDESASYASQTDALVTASTANAAVQMAIMGEFYCKEYSTIVENDCWLWGIKEPTMHSASKNMFNKDTSTDENYIYTTGDIWTAAQGNYYKQFSVSDYIPVIPGQTYTITNVRPGDSFSSGVHYYNADKVWQRYTKCQGQTQKIRPNNNEVYIRFNMLTSQKDEVQMEQGSVGTSYEPYQNLYIPQNQ